MKKVILLAVLSSLALSGCQALLDDYRATHPEPVLAGPADTSKMEGCDEACQEQWRIELRERSKNKTWADYHRMPQPYDTHEYQVQINGKTVTCRPGLNTGFKDGINHNVECK